MGKLLEYARLLVGRPKNPIAKRKRKILKETNKELDRLEGYKTARTRDIERRTGVASDIEKRKRDVARRARKTLLGKG